MLGLPLTAWASSEDTQNGELKEVLRGLSAWVGDDSKQLVTAPAEDAGTAHARDAVMRIRTLDDLRHLSPPAHATHATIDGYYTANDGGGGAFVWDPASTLADNGGSVIKPARVSGAGRWRFDGVADIRRYGAKPDDTKFNNIPAFKAALASSGIIQLNGGSFYNVFIASEADTLTGDIEIQFNGPAIRHCASAFLLINCASKRLTFRGAARLIFAGSYPKNAGVVKKYGEKQPSDAQFCGFIRYGGASIINIERIEAVGESDANLYDFVLRGDTGSFHGSNVGSMFASHYARAIANNTVGMRFGSLEGTKRHNHSMQHYGQGHFAYINLIDARIDRVKEYGSIIQGPSGKIGFDASVQITAFNNASIGEIITTMEATSAFSLKGQAKNWRVGSIMSKSEGFDDPAGVNTVLVDIQTNLEATVRDGVIESCTVYLPVSSINRTGFWAGGTGLSANVFVIAPDAGSARPAAIASVVTCAKSQITIKTLCSRKDDFILFGKSVGNKVAIEHAGAYAETRSGPSMTRSIWAASKNNTVIISGTPPTTGVASVRWLTDPSESVANSIHREQQKPNKK
ncbi:hypothetical protein [Variovorax sp. V512]